MESLSTKQKGILARRDNRRIDCSTMKKEKEGPEWTVPLSGAVPISAGKRKKGGCTPASRI